VAAREAAEAAEPKCDGDANDAAKSDGAHAD
jgi:hypothetical protein